MERKDSTVGDQVQGTLSILKEKSIETGETEVSSWVEGLAVGNGVGRTDSRLKEGGRRAGRAGS